MTTPIPTVSGIDDIVIGDRHRHDLGDIDALADSIDELGLLHPVVVTRDNVLVAGERRLAAVRSLGWDEVPVTIAHNLADAADYLKAERDENTCRKPMTPTEEHSIYQALLEIERVEARERQAEGQREGGAAHASGKLSRKQPEQRAKSRAAEAATGKAGRARTLDKVGETKRIADDPKTPEPVREVAKSALAGMDETGRVDGFHRAVKEAETAQATATITEAIDKRDPGAADERARAQLKADYSRAMLALPRVTELDAEAVAFVLDDNEVAVLVGSAQQVTKWAESVRDVKRRSGLSLINGGAK